MTTEATHLLKVFLCHASGDKPPVRELYKRLVAEGVDAWLDQERLLPGQDWRLEIPKAVKEADVVVICLSKKSITKEGYVQKEIKFALDIAEEKPEGTIFLIPARLEDCVVPERLSRWQWVDLFDEGGFVRLLRSLKLRAEAVGAIIEPVSYVDPDKEREKRIKQLYTEGLAAYYTEDWDRACQRFQSILSEQPNHKNAAEKLAEADRQRSIFKLYEQALEAVRGEDWGTAIQTLEELSEKSASYKETAQLLKNARKQQQLRALYTEAKTLHEAQKWEAAVRVFDQISGIDPSFGDPDGLLSSAQREVAELKRIADLNDLYSRAVEEMDAGHWLEARKLLEATHKSQTGFLETEKLLRTVEGEITKEEQKRKQNNQINTLYEQAHGLLRSKKWRNVLDKMAEIRKLDERFPDTDGIAEKAQKELAREEQEAERQNKLAALYAEAVRLLKEEKYQEALDKWGEVRSLDPKYPDRQWVGRAARRKLLENSRDVDGTQIRFPSIKKRLVPIISLAALILLGSAGLYIFVNQPPVLPQCASAINPSNDDPLSIESNLSLSPVVVDGKITFPTEWKNAKCSTLYLLWDANGGCTEDNRVLSTWFFMNDRKNLYMLVLIIRAGYVPRGIELVSFMNVPPYSDQMAMDFGEPVDQFGWNDVVWREDFLNGGSIDTRGKSTEDDLYYWFELSKPLDSRDGHDWSWKPGDKLGDQSTGGLHIASWGDEQSGESGNCYGYRTIQLQLGK